MHNNHQPKAKQDSKLMTIRLSSPHELTTLLTKLSNLQPYRPSDQIGREQRNTERMANWMLGIGCGLLLSVLLLAIYLHFWNPAATWIKPTALWIAVIVQVLGLLSLLVRSMGVLLLATKWKRISLTTLLREVEVDEAHAQSLVSTTSPHLRKRAEQHLQLKQSRLERRITSVLGEKTAAGSLIALTLPMMKEAGGFSQLQNAMSSGFNLTNWELLFVYFFAFVLGASLGAIGLKVIAGRIRYQLEILALTHEEKPAAGSQHTAASEVLNTQAAALSAASQ